MKKILILTMLLVSTVYSVHASSEVIHNNDTLKSDWRKHCDNYGMRDNRLWMNLVNQTSKYLYVDTGRGPYSSKLLPQQEAVIECNITQPVELNDHVHSYSMRVIHANHNPAGEPSCLVTTRYLVERRNNFHMRITWAENKVTCTDPNKFSIDVEFYRKPPEWRLFADDLIANSYIKNVRYTP